ncbi:MAG: isoprenylcysteine carboxylmethyltransferase family protein [Bacteriovoracaceae bacterium]|nr:isoprenylcysteine carboxylmethyltransferase family protein [Bacteriovoracaceae bacterium]
MKDFQGKLPIILSILFVGSISISSYFRCLNLVGNSLLIPTIIFAFLYLLWLVLEAKVAKKEIGQNETNIDFGSLEVYALSRATVVLTGLIIPGLHQELNPLAIAGLVIFIILIAFRLYAINHLGQFYSHRVRIKEEHTIINTGPYNYIRHPAYTGMILGHLGFSLFFFNYWTLGIWAFFHVPAVVYRILVEEKALYELPGYPEYAAKRKRLVPFIW